MADDYQPYDLDSIEKVVRATLNRVLQRYEAAREEHRRTYLPAYENYPFRGEQGIPEWKGFSESDREKLLAVKWPSFIGFFIPSLKDKVIVTGADVLDGSLNQEKGLAGLKRRFKLYAWKRWKKDDSAYRDAIQACRDTYERAYDAWNSLKFRYPRLSRDVINLQEKIAEFDKLKRRQKSGAQVVWLKQDEYDDLRWTIREGNFVGINQAIFPILDSSNYFFGGHILSNEFVAAWRELTAPDNGREEINPELIHKIKETLKKNPHGEYLVNMAEKNGLRFHLRRRKEGPAKTPLDPGAYIRGKDIYLVNADEAYLVDSAVSLGHELRHHWQDVNFKTFYDEHNTIIDKLVRTRLIEADAYAFTLLLAFNFKQQGMTVSYWNEKQLTGQFEDIYRKCVDQYKREPKEAQNQTMTVAFAIFVAPGPLDPYEHDHARLLEPLPDAKDLPKLIAQSPYFQADFINRLATIEGVPYLEQDDLHIVQEYLQKIGQSEHARPTFSKLQPIKFAL